MQKYTKKLPKNRDETNVRVQFVTEMCHDGKCKRVRETNVKTEKRSKNIRISKRNNFTKWTIVRYN